MKLIVGLGNPDREYLNTYHNLGFMSVDSLASELGVSFNKQKCRAMLAEYGVGKNKILIAKPLTYMNLSGESVRELVSFYKIDLSDLVVIYDDYDLEKGFIRVRGQGSAGSHNGMRNIIKELGAEGFARIRVGFKSKGEENIPLLNLVLSGIKPEDKEIFEKTTKLAGEAGYDFANGKSIDYLMQKYNRKR